MNSREACSSILTYVFQLIKKDLNILEFFWGYICNSFHAEQASVEQFKITGFSGRPMPEKDRFFQSTD